MAVSVLMPKAGISVESCIIGEWHKKLGDYINIGDKLFDYETDKATFECESTAEGTLLDIFFESGDEVPCLVAVCAIGQAGEDVSALRPDVTMPSVEKQEQNIEQETKHEDAKVHIASVDASGAVSPRAKNTAQRLRVDLRAVMPSGPNGRVIERDVLAAVGTGANIGGRRDDGFIGGTREDVACAAEFVDEKMTPVRKAIARSMSKSLAEIAQLTHHHSCDASTILNLRQRLKQRVGDMGLDGISVNDMVMFAVVKTLLAHPDMNSHLIDGNILRKFFGVHLGMAVDTPRGLLVPTIFNADKMSLLQLSKASKEVAAQAKSGNISPDLLQGASFTVSNLGALGVEMFTPVINPPQVAILGICGISTKVRETNGNIEAYQSIGLSLTYDHRAVDGAPASRFARDLAKNIENFDLMMLLESI